MLGDIFGANLNRKDVLAFQMDAKLAEVVRSKEEVRMLALIENASTLQELEQLRSHLTESITYQFEEKWSSLQPEQ